MINICVQNNCELTDNIEDEVLANAWKYLETYLKWEDDQNRENPSLN